jgi:hypothetical protein
MAPRRPRPRQTTRAPLSRFVEREADGYAAETLIPSRNLQEFIGQSDFSKLAVRKFSDGVGVHPGIVVGRLRHDSIIQQNVHADLIMPLHSAQEET